VSHAPIKGTKFADGAASDGKHYWLTPPAMLEDLRREFGELFDACPYPCPQEFDGLTAPWGPVTYINPPFGSIIHRGRKKGVTAWVRRAIAEQENGNTSIIVYPLDKWILMLLAAGAEVTNLGDVKWHATEDGSEGKGTGRHIARFVLRGRTAEAESPQ